MIHEQQFPTGGKRILLPSHYVTTTTQWVWHSIYEYILYNMIPETINIVLIMTEFYNSCIDPDMRTVFNLT